MCCASVSSGLGGRHFYFRYNATSGDIVDSTTEQLDFENMDVAVEILSIVVLVLEINLGVFQKTFLKLHAWQFDREENFYIPQ